MRIFADDERLRYCGRIDWSNSKEPVFVFPCTSVEMRFTGEMLKAYVRNHNAWWENYLGVIVDGEQRAVRLPKEGETVLELPVNNSEIREHEVMLFKRQDACHETAFLGFEIDGDILHMGTPSGRKIEVYGDSVSAGEVSEAVEYTGMEDPEHNGEYSNSWYSYAWMTARRLNAQIHDIAQGGIALLDKTGWFCEPEAVGMESVWDRIRYNPMLGASSRWDFERYVPQIVIVAIGQNDSHPYDCMKEDWDGEQARLWRARYRGFLKKLRKQYPDTHIVCITTLLCHDASWDRAVKEAVDSMEDGKVTQYIFKRNGCGTPGHLRICEAEEMAEELSAYIEELYSEN